MEIEHQLGNGMAINATAYIGERHVLTRIETDWHGLQSVQQTLTPREKM